MKIRRVDSNVTSGEFPPQKVLKNGSKYTGRLTDKYTDDAKRFMFRHSAGITNEYNRSDVKEIIPLNVVDGD